MLSQGKVREFCFSSKSQGKSMDFSQGKVREKFLRAAVSKFQNICTLNPRPLVGKGSIKLFP